jgi:hypothetical protein
MAATPTIVAVVAVAGAAGLGGYLLHDQLPMDPFALFERPLIRACEDGIRETLVAPRTYRRVWVGDVKEEEISLDAYWAVEGKPSPAVEEFERREHEHATRWTVSLEWEASNRMGVPLRSGSKCSYAAIGDSERHADAFGVVIDGKSWAQRLVDP